MVGGYLFQRGVQALGRRIYENAFARTNDTASARSTVDKVVYAASHLHGTGRIDCTLDLEHLVDWLTDYFCSHPDADEDSISVN